MRTNSKKPKASQQTKTATSTKSSQIPFGQSRDVHSILQLQNMLGNQAVQRMLDANIGDNTGEPTATATSRFDHDFSRIPVHSITRAVIQPKLTVNTHGDIYEQEADRVADRVMQMPDHGTPLNAHEEGDSGPKSLILGRQEKSVGRKGIEDEEEPSKKHAVAEKCASEEYDKHLEEKVGLTQSLAFQARALTPGSGIFFRAGEYGSGSTERQRLLANELTHSVQQGASRHLNSPYIGTRSTATPLVQREPAPVAAPVAVPAGRATLNFLPVIHDQTPKGWGVTIEDDAIIDITAYASGGVWKCVITKANQQARQGVRLLPGVVEVTSTLVNKETSCGRLKTMITSLNSVASQRTHSGFYMLSAVQAHEDVHIKQYRADLTPHYTTLKTAVEALSVPFASHANAAAAKAAIKALPAYTVANATFHAADVAANNKTASHPSMAPFNAAEHGVVDPMITTIKARRTELKCAP